MVVVLLLLLLQRRLKGPHRLQVARRPVKAVCDFVIPLEHAEGRLVWRSVGMGVV